MDFSQYKFDLQKSPIDPRDLMLETIYPESVTLPKVWDYRLYMRAVRDQGREGTCSAQTISAIKEWQEYSDIGFKEHMSPWFVYKLRSNQGQEGMTPRDTMDILYKIGIVPESDYTYLTTKPITEELKQKAITFKIQGYAQINTIESLQKALFMNGPCYIAFPVYNPEKLEFWKPDYTGQTMIGGHAVTVVGYNESRFIIRNSWSSQWGDQGHTYMPFTDWGCQWEIWTTIDADSNSQNLYNKSSQYTCSRGLFRRIFGRKKNQ